MTAMRTADQLAARTGRAIAAATEAGRGLGRTVEAPTVLHDVFSVIVHLAPAPVVVRVPTVLPRTVAVDPAGQAAQQRRELAVAGWLAGQGHPVVAPSPLVAAQPVRAGGFGMTFWTFVEQLPDPGTGRGAELAAELHAALRGYPEDLPLLSCWTRPSRTASTSWNAAPTCSAPRTWPGPAGSGRCWSR